MMRVVLNINREAAAQFIHVFATSNSGFGLADTYFDIKHGTEETVFEINGHDVSSVSNQMNQIVIDRCYCYAGGVPGSFDYCLKKLGF